jgi:VanZ family protein
MLRNNKFSIILALIIAYLSLAGSQSFDDVPLFDIPFLDKIVHFGMYFVFMSVMIFENRKTIKATSHLLLLSLIPVSYGLLMEILQVAITETRSGDMFDFLSNTAGALVSLLIWIWIKPAIKETVR